MQDRDRLLQFLRLRFQQETPKEVSHSPKYQCACAWRPERGCHGLSHLGLLDKSPCQAARLPSSTELKQREREPSLGSSAGLAANDALCQTKHFSQQGWQMLSLVRVSGCLILSCAPVTPSQGLFTARMKIYCKPWLPDSQSCLFLQVWSIPTPAGITARGDFESTGQLGLYRHLLAVTNLALKATTKRSVS